MLICLTCWKAPKVRLKKGGTYAKTYAPTICFIFSVRRLVWIQSQMCRRKTEQIRSGKQKAATRYTHAGVHAAHHAYIIKSWHILPTTRVLFLHCTYWATRKFRTRIRAHVRTRVRRELLRRRGFDQADSKGCNPLPPVATDVRHVWSFRKIKRRLEQLGNFRFFNLSLPLILSFSTPPHPFFLAVALRSR